MVVLLRLRYSYCFGSLGKTRLTMCYFDWEVKAMRLCRNNGLPLSNKLR